MGFNASDLRFLLSAEKMGLQGRNLCTLGRLTLLLSQRELNTTLLDYAKTAVRLPGGRAMHFADDVLVPLGYRVDAMDNSNYEGATILHDLNAPIPSSLCESYDIVWDGGTLEHVFNFPLALHNSMKMLRHGGH